MDKPYNRLLTPCSLSQVAMEECAIRMKPSHTYELHVANQQHPFAVMLVKKIGAFTEDHPFAPQINVVLDRTLCPNEWYICTETESWGTEGV